MFELDGKCVRWFVNSSGYVEYEVLAPEDGGVTDILGDTPPEEVERILTEELG